MTRRAPCTTVAAKRRSYRFNPTAHTRRRGFSRDLGTPCTIVAAKRRAYRFNPTTHTRRSGFSRDPRRRG